MATGLAVSDLAKATAFYVDVLGLRQLHVERGGRITREPAPYGDNIVGFAVDPDGFLLELIQAPSK